MCKYWKYQQNNLPIWQSYNFIRNNPSNLLKMCDLMVKKLIGQNSTISRKSLR